MLKNNTELIEEFLYEVQETDERGENTVAAYKVVFVKSEKNNNKVRKS